jgi:hypothetical protein
MRPKAKAATPNAWRPRFELGVDTVILFSIPVTQVCHDPGEPVVGNAHLNNRGSQRMHRALYNRKDQGYSATQHRGILARDRLLDSRRHADFPLLMAVSRHPDYFRVADKPTHDGAERLFRCDDPGFR